MTLRSKKGRVTVFGGSGFLGSRIVEALAAEGFRTCIAARRPSRARRQRSAQKRGDFETAFADVRDESSVARALEGSDAAINAVGLYVEHGSTTFEAIHVQGAGNVARQCRINSVDSLVHISGIGVDATSASRLLRSRANGEFAVTEALPTATILRPSILFGPRDKFITPLAEMMRYAPAMPLFGCGLTRLQLAFVDDVAHAVANAIRRADARGRIYELGGPRIYAYKEVLELIEQALGRRIPTIPVPYTAWEGLATAASLLPDPPITPDLLALLRRDNVVAQSALSFEDLGIEPARLEDVLPDMGLSRARA